MLTERMEAKRMSQQMDWYLQEVERYEELGFLRKKTLMEELDIIAQRFPHHLAVVEGNRRLTYEELLQEIKQLSTGFLSLGWQQGDRVLMQLPNTIEFITVLFSLLKIGVQPVLMLPSHREVEIDTVAKMVQPIAYICCSSYLGFQYECMAAQVIPQHKSIRYIVTVGESTIQWPASYTHVTVDQLKERNYSLAISASPHYRDTALYLLSGGTTGIPKIIPKIHEAYAYNAFASAEKCGMTPETAYMAVLSISHDYPLCSPGILGTLFTGGKVVLCQTSSFDEAFHEIEKEQVTHTAIVPTIASLWLEAFEWYEDLNMSSLEVVLIGAAHIEQEMAVQFMNTFHCKIQQGYGLGEGITCFTALNDPVEIVTSCQGQAISIGDEIKIIDELGREVPQGQLGELVAKGPYTFGGYYQASALNAEIFTKDYFLRTGDKARITSDGNIQIIGRVREQINRAGENVIPSEIESFLRTQPMIKDAAVVGLPDKDLGESICAFIVTDGQRMERDEICSYLFHIGVAPYKLPDRIIYVERLPFINVGKVDKKKLKQMAMESEASMH